MSGEARDHLYLWNGVLLYVTQGEHNNDWHSHYAASVLICPDASFRLQTREQEHQCQVAVLAPNTENRIDVQGRLLALMVDPDSAAYLPLASYLDGAAAVTVDDLSSGALLRQVSQLFERSPDQATAQLAVDDIIEALTGQRPAPQPRHLDARIVNVLHRIRDALPEEIPVETLAEEVELSRSRLLHLFKEQLGLPMGQYLLWRRLYESVRLWDEGMNMTDAAHAAGFYDQSHYTRTMRRMLDVTPSEVARNPQLKIHHGWRDMADMPE